MRNLRRNNGITLIALIVTIVVLLILAGITIQLILSDGGIFNQAGRSKEQTRIGELLDKFNISEAAVSLEKWGKPSLEDYIKQIKEKEKYIVEIEKQEDGSYNVISEDGYVFNVAIIEGTDTNDIVINYVGKAGNLPPIIEVKNITTNSAEIEVKRTGGASNIKYEYKKNSETTYQTATGTGNTCIYTGLENNTVYDIKITITRDGKDILAEQSIIVGKIPTGVIKLKSTTWTGGKATVTVYHEETENYRIEWQKQGEQNWNRGEMGQKEVSIPNLNHEDTILVRLNDGVSGGNDASISIIDDIKPQIAVVSFSPETVSTGSNITATVTLQDEESGIDNSNSRYEFNKSSTPLGTEDASLYTTGTFENTRTPTIKANSAGKWYLHVLSVDNAGNKIETISKEIVITQAEISDLDRSKGIIEIAFVDMENNPISANEIEIPRLGTDMTPIKWDGNKVTTTTTSDDEWYDYSQKKWANAQTSDGSMWVWIPRYSYKISYKNASGTVIGYSDSDGITDVNGNIVIGTKKQEAVEIKGTVDGKIIEKYVLHPAFTTNTTNGGWNKDIQGIWVAKFEASRVDATIDSAGKTDTIKIQAGVKEWRSIDLSNIFIKCKEYKETYQSHMMKNSEWGCTAYLATSRYGKNDKITINDEEITGGGSGTAYLSNKAQSTTGNIYGVYDMSGGTSEYTAAYVNNGDSSLTSRAANLVNSKEWFKNIYSKGSSDSKEKNYQENKDKYGDAIYETSNHYNNSTGSWYEEDSRFPDGSGPFFRRGGNYASDSVAGVFGFNSNNGNSSIQSNAFRPVLILND